MFETVTAPLVGWRSNAFVETIRLVGWDFTGADIRLEVRDRRDGGALRAGLDDVVSSSAEGVTITVTEEDGVDVTTLGIRINESTMEAMPDAPEPGDDIELVWGMHIDPAGSSLKFMAFDGPFTVKASAPA